MMDTETEVRNTEQINNAQIYHLGLLMSELKCAAERIISDHGFKTDDCDTNGLINPVCLRNIIIRAEFDARHESGGDRRQVYTEIADEYKISPRTVHEIVSGRR